MQRLEQQGEEVLNPRGGWPDLFTKTPEGKYRAYEIKGGSHPVHAHQHRMLGVLHELGVEVFIVHYDADGSYQGTERWNPPV